MQRQLKTSLSSTYQLDSEQSISLDVLSHLFVYT